MREKNTWVNNGQNVSQIFWETKIDSYEMLKKKKHKEATLMPALEGKEKRTNL